MPKRWGSLVLFGSWDLRLGIRNPNPNAQRKGFEGFGVLGLRELYDLEISA